MTPSTTDERKLIGVKPDLVRAVREAFRICPFRIAVLEGVRTAERQRDLYAQGRTKPGRIVTWTMASKHLTGDAVDLGPIGPGLAIPWNDTQLFIEMGKHVLAAAKACGVKIRWGYDWDGDGKLQEKGEYDGPHFELA